ncbi:cytochrome P450 [Gynuella sunshinyii YC6258]|uniref:Cytochrome P450 n=2 Tax=Gynuella sunshinyii TaxID=1445505 RepID=A0A0C5VPU3_9GAMM|nr:cytochrome P450 [Gynuella sunshinyii YC6258]
MQKTHQHDDSSLNSQFNYLFNGLFKTSIPLKNKLFLKTSIGPTPYWPLGNAHNFLGQSPYMVLKQYNDSFGNTVTFWLLKKANVLLVDPRDIQVLFEQYTPDIFKDSPKHAAGKYFRRSVFFANGSEWEKKRQHHPLSHQNIKSFFGMAQPMLRNICKHYINRINAFDEPKEIPLFDEMTRLSFEIFCQFMLGEKATYTTFDAYLTQMQDMHRRGTSLFPITGFSTARKAGYWRRKVEKTINSARNSPQKSFFSLPGWLSDQGQIDDSGFKLLRDEISTAFYAGTRNVASAVSFLIQLIAAHPDKYTQLQQTIDAFMQNHPNGYQYEDLAELEYLDCTLKETLRLYPTVPAFFREVLPGRQLELPSVVLPEKTQIFISSWVTHRNPELWPSPENFQPERFFEEPQKYTYFPFGVGRQICVGKAMTDFIVKVTVIELLSQLKFESLLPHNTSYIDNEYFSGIIIPSNGLAIKVRNLSSQQR